MKVKVLNITRKELKIEIEGEGHTFCNVIQKALIKDKRVELAGYDIPHPLTSNPLIYVRTKGQSKPTKILKDATKAIQKDSKAFRAAYNKALKEWKDKQLS
jgi:DNA-directed RNA polymerase subunit L